RNRDSLSSNFGISTLVEKHANGLQRGISIRNVGFNQAQHGFGGRRQANKAGIVNLTKSQKTKNGTNARMMIHDTEKNQKTQRERQHHFNFSQQNKNESKISTFFFVLPTNANNKSNFGFSRREQLTSSASFATKKNLLFQRLLVFSLILFSTNKIFS